MSNRAELLAQRIEQGAEGLAAYAEGLSDAQWVATVAPDCRKVGVIINHVGSVYPIEIHLAVRHRGSRVRHS